MWEQAAVMKVQADAQNLRQARTMQNYGRVARQYQEFLDYWGGDLLTTSAEDVLIYLQTWVPRVLFGDRPWAPSTLRGHVSSLSRVWQLLGRGKMWDVTQRVGNPAASTLVSDHLTCYSAERQKAGYAPQSAVPLFQEELMSCVESCRIKGAQSFLEGRRLKVLRHGRDSLLLVWLYETSRRGADVLDVEWSQLRKAGEERAIAGAFADEVHVEEIWISFVRVKNSKHSRPATVVVHRNEDPEFCPVEALRRWYHTLMWAKEPAEGPVFCVYGDSEEPGAPHHKYTSSALGSRFSELTREIGKRTVHGIRRGRLQEDKAHGARRKELKHTCTAAIRTDRVVDVYCDPARHLPVHATH
jgi:hypothetical protein